MCTLPRCPKALWPPERLKLQPHVTVGTRPPPPPPRGLGSRTWLTPAPRAPSDTRTGCRKRLK